MEYIENVANMVPGLENASLALYLPLDVVFVFSNNFQGVIRFDDYPKFFETGMGSDYRIGFIRNIQNGSQADSIRNLMRFRVSPREATRIE